MEKVCGLLIEPRGLSNIKCLIDNYFKVAKNPGNEKLSKLYFYCGISKYNFYSKLYKNDNNIEIISLNVDNLQVHEHNNLLKSLIIWEKLQSDGYTHVLTIQTDGCLCESSKFVIDDFLKYDYIGGYSPYKWWWKETQGLHDFSDYQSFNGGFSLRKIDALIKVIKTFGTLPSRGYEPNLEFTAYGEDLYFVCGMLKLGYIVAKDQYSINFCTHTHYIKDTFCVHKLDNYVELDEIIRFLKYCPEFLPFVAKYNFS